MLTTNLSDTVRQAGSDEQVSVIHAPESFATWVKYSAAAASDSSLTITKMSGDPKDRRGDESSARVSPRSDGASQAAMDESPTKVP